MEAENLETNDKLPDDIKIDFPTGNNDQSWMPLFLSIFNMLNGNNSNVMLEKEVSYLQGKVDTLEKIVMKKED